MMILKYIKTFCLIYNEVMSFPSFIFFRLLFFPYFCNVFMPMLHLEVAGGGDRHIDNGVFLRFGFDDSKS